MNDTRYDFLTYTTLADDEYRQVGMCHLQGYVQRSVESWAVAYDVVSLLYILEFFYVHRNYFYSVVSVRLLFSFSGSAGSAAFGAVVYVTFSLLCAAGSKPFFFI